MTLKSTCEIVPCYQDLVSFVLSHATYDPHKAILIDATNNARSISLCQAQRLVSKLVYGFQLHGLKDADTVCLHMFNDIMYPILFLGIVGARGRFAGSNPAYTVAELSHHFKISQTNIVITRSAHLAVVREAAANSGIAHRDIFVYDHDGEISRSGFLTLSDLMSHGQASWASFEDAEMAMTTHASLMSTSGTTGLPKMAVKSHHSLVMENLAIEDRTPKSYQVKRLICAPFFHAFASPLALISPLRSGHTTYIMQKFDQSIYLSVVERYNITETCMPPPLIVRFLAMPESERRMLRKLELIWSGGATMSATTQNSALKMFAPSARIVQVWGMTEGGWMTTFAYPEADYSGSVGRLIGSYEAKLIDDQGHELTTSGARGEICVRGPLNMICYHNNEQASKATMDANGWLKTGDVATIDKGGKIYIVDRKKELIKVRGWQVAPGELESSLLAHEDILDAAVIGVPHLDQGAEVPRAFAVRKPGSTVSEEAIRSYMLRSLAKYKVMDCQVVFRDNIPKSASGKILKKVLREEVASERRKHKR